MNTDFMCVNGKKTKADWTRIKIWNRRYLRIRGASPHHGDFPSGGIGISAAFNTMETAV